MVVNSNDTISKKDPLSRRQVNLYNKNFEFAEFAIDFEQQFIINNDTRDMVQWR